MMKKLLREPLVHFLILGAAVFLLFNVAAKPGAPQDGRIVVTPGKIEQLAIGFSRTWQRPPTVEELNGLIEDQVKGGEKRCQEPLNRYVQAEESGCVADGDKGS